MPRPLFSHVLNLRQPSGGGGGGGGAPTAASYLVLGLDATLTAERVLTAGVGIAFADTGPNGTLTITNTGVPGPVGPEGPAGSTGPTGATGITGPAGVLGFPGEEGDEGAVGPQGIRGLPGLAGPPAGAATVVSANVTTSLAFSTTETTLVTLPSLTTAGGSVAITGWMGLEASTAINSGGLVTFNIYRDGSTLIKTVQTSASITGAGDSIVVPLGAGTIIDTPAMGLTAGAHTWTIKALTSTTNLAILSTPANAGTYWAWELTGAGPPGIGMPGLDGIDGDDGWPGPPGPQGIQGLQGIQGALGSAGIPGLDGLDGDDGFMGPPGPAGAAGVAGTAGPRGLPGMDGLDGDDGPMMPGPPGIQGIQGLQGPPGSGSSGTGTPGLDGLDGEDAWWGLPGPQGPIGPQGPAGGGGGSASMGPPGLDGEDAGGEAPYPGQHTYNAQDLQQLWWPSMQSYVPASIDTRNLASFTSSFDMSPAGGVHTLNGLNFVPTITTAPGVTDSSNLTAINLNPTMTMGQNVFFKGVNAAGTYTNTVGAFTGAWTLFSATPTLSSATASISPYRPLIYDCSPIIQFNSTGTPALSASNAFRATCTFKNLGAGTFQVNGHTDFHSLPTLTQSAGSLSMISIKRFAAFAPTVTGAVSITEDLAFVSSLTSSVQANRGVQETGGATSEFKGLIIRSYTPTAQTIPTGYYVIFSKRQQWTSTQRLTMRGTARLRGN